MKCSLCVLSLLEYNPGKFTVSLDRIWEKKQGTDEDLLYGGRNKKKKKKQAEIFPSLFNNLRGNWNDAGCL